MEGVLEVPSAVRADNPYVGPRPFTVGETIYGRDDDCEKVVRLLTGERILVLHSPSGAGKSSLINAAVMPRLRKGYAPQPPLTIGRPQSSAEGAATGPGQLREYFTRVSGQPQGRSAPTPVQRLLSGWNARLPSAQQLSAADVAAYTIPRFAAYALSLQDGARFPVFVFDQFEDIFTESSEGSAGVAEFFRQLGELLTAPEIYGLIALREEYLGNLEPYRNLIPGALRARYRLDLLTPQQAVEAVRFPAVKLRGVNFDESDAGELVTRLLQTVPGPGMPQRTGRFVEPVLLQVVCKQMWDRLPRDATKVPAQIIPGEEQIRGAIGDFYADAIKGVAESNNVDEGKLREWVVTGLIQGHIRAQVRSGPLGTAQDGAILSDLEREYLIRPDIRGETTWYELSHDRLVQPILDNQSEWEVHLPAQDQLLRRAADAWQQRGRDDYYLLRGRTLHLAEDWVKANRPHLTKLEIAFLDRCKREHRRAWMGRLTAVVTIVFMAAALMFVFAGISAVRKGAAAKRQIEEARETSARAETDSMQAAAAVKVAKEEVENAQAKKDGAERTAANSREQAAKAKREEAAAKHNFALLKSQHERDMEANRLAIEAESKQLNGIREEVARQDRELKQSQQNLEDTTNLATERGVDAERLNALIELRTQAAAAARKLGENTRKDALDLIGALKHGIERHRIIEESALSNVPVLLQASLNRQTLRQDTPLAGVGTALKNGKLLAVTNSGALRFTIGDANGGGAVERKVFRLCLDRGAMRFMATTPPENDRAGCKKVSWPTAVAAGGGTGEVLVGFPNGRIFLWNWETVRSTEVKGHRHPIVTMEFSDDAKSSFSASAFWSFTVASLGDRSRRAYRKPGMLDWGRITIWGGGSELVRSARFLGDSGLLAIGFEDGRVELWSASHPKRFATKREHWAAVLSLASDGAGSQLLSTDRDGTVHLWKIEHEAGKDPSLVHVIRLQPRSSETSVVLSSAFDPAGARFALGLGDGRVQVWDARADKQILELRGHSGSVTGVRFLARDLLVSVGEDGTMRTWRVPPENETAALQSLVSAIKESPLPATADVLLSDEDARYWMSILERSEAFLGALK